MPWHIKREWGFPWPALVQVPPSDAFVRVSQAFLEVPYAIPPTVRTTQVFAEVPYSVADQSVRVTQAFLEVVYKIVPDPDFASVILLTGFDTYVSGTTFTEESSYARTVTLAASASVTTSSPIIGTKSGVSGASGTSFFTVPDDDIFTFALNEPFTIEAKVNFNTSPGGDVGFVSQWGVGTGSWALWRTGNKLAFRFINAAVVTIDVTPAGTWTISTGTTYTCAVDRTAAGVIRVYLDGVMIAKSTGLTDEFQNSPGNVVIGGIGGFTLTPDAKLDEVRVTKGVARYASDGGYTPAVIAFPRT